ncbi:MAG TPA: hypothetical protein VGL71_00410 [Urbifossiella sp.]|jgi:hypothetical protein
MKLAPIFNGAVRMSDAAASRRFSLFSLPLVVALFLMPIVGHGCHGDDIDHEPTTVPFQHDRKSSQ